MEAPAKGSEDAHAEAEGRDQEGSTIAEPIGEGSPGEAAEGHKALEDEQIDAEGARSYPVGGGVLGGHVETGHHCHPRQAAQGKCGQQYEKGLNVTESQSRNGETETRKDR